MDGSRANEGGWGIPHTGGKLGELKTRAPDGGLRRGRNGGVDVRWGGERGWWRTPHAGEKSGELKTRAPVGGLRRGRNGGVDVRWEWASRAPPGRCGCDAFLVIRGSGGSRCCAPSPPAILLSPFQGGGKRGFGSSGWRRRMGADLERTIIGRSSANKGEKTSPLAPLAGLRSRAAKGPGVRGGGMVSGVDGGGVV